MSDKNEEEKPMPKKGIVKSYVELCKKDSSHLYGFIGVLALILTVLSIALTISGPVSNPAASLDLVKPAIGQVAKMDGLRKKNILKLVDAELARKTEIISKPTQRVLVDEIPEINNQGFRLENYTVINDLRKFKDVPSVSHGDLISPVTQSIRQTIVKKDSNASIYRIKSSTSGVDVFAKSITHPDRLTVYAPDILEPRGPYQVKPRIMEFDVSGDPKRFALEAVKTFWNAFQNEDQSWAGLNVPIETGFVRLVILFPEDKPYKSFEHFEHDADGNRTNNMLNTNYVLDDEKNHLWIVWDIVDPKAGHGYNIDWEW